MRTLTGFALTAPITDFPAALDSVARWPTENTRDQPIDTLLSNGTPGEQENMRIDRANYVLAHAFTTRATATAIRYHASLSADAAAHFRPGLLAALTSVDPALARAELLKIPGGPERQTAALIAVTALASKDPAAALALVSEMDVIDAITLPEVLRKEACDEILVGWYQASSADAVSWVNHHIPADERPALFERMFGRMGRDHFARALQWEKSADPIIRAAATKVIEAQINWQPMSVICDRIQSAGWKSVRFGAAGDFMGLSLDTLLPFVAAQPPDQIRKMFLNLPPDAFNAFHNVDQIVSLWALHDPEAALAWAQKIPGSDVRHAALLRVNALLTESDPVLALTQIDATPPGPFRIELVQATALALAKKDFPTALDWTLQLPAGPEKAAAVAVLAETGWEYDPAALVVALAKLAAGQDSNDVIQTFTYQWIQGDTAAALDWFVQLPPGSLRETIQDTTADFASRFVPERAFALAQTLPAGPERSAFIQALADHQAAAHPDAVLALINSLPPSSGRTFATESVLRSLIKDNPAAALAYFEAGAFGPSRPTLIGRIAVDWSDQFPAGSARWLSTQLKAQDNDSLLVFSGVAQVARNYAAQDPESALAWASGLADPKASQRALSEVIPRVAKNPALARRLLEAGTLPDDVKTQLQAATVHP